MKRMLARAMACAAAAFTLMSLAVAPASAAEYRDLRLAANNECMDVYMDRRFNGASVIFYPCHGGDNQKWEIRGGGTYKQVVSKRTGRCLQSGIDLSGEESLFVYNCDASKRNQQWRQQRPFRDDRFMLVSADGGKVVDAPVSRDGDKFLHMWNPHFGSNQLWRVGW